MDFSLVERPWVPVMWDGTRREVSLLEALTQAHRIGGIALDDPLQAVAILRQVLLPVVLDAVGVPRTHPEWADRWSVGAFDAAVLDGYLAEHAHRFDLFDPVAPFAQVAGLHTDRDETKPVSLLIPSAAAGNNVPLFSVRTEADPPALQPAQAARAALAAHCWDTAAIKSGAVGDPKQKAGKTTGNPTGPLGQLGVIVPVGRTLFETLMLNTPILSGGLNPGDRPQWRAEPATPRWQTRPDHGLLDLLTWQSRRVRLVPETDGSGAVVVRRVVLAAGDRLEPLPQYEPHTAWKQIPNPRSGQGSTRPLRHQPGRSAWRGLAALLATRQATDDGVSSSRLLRQISELRFDGHLPEDFRLQVLTAGVAYGNQSAVVEDIMVDLIPLPVLALTDSEVHGFLLDVVGHADQLRVAANRLGDELRQACGGDKLPWDKSQRLGDTLVHELTPTVRRLLAGLQREPDRVEEADRAWRDAARALALDIAEPALMAAPPEAFLGRPAGQKYSYRLGVAERRYRAEVRTILGIDASDTAPVGARP